MDLNFVALDFETATFEKHSACEVGICIVENGEIKETKNWLIKPPSYPYFHPKNIEIHGIHPEDVANSPTFEELWYELENHLYGNIMIAHNASFDSNIMRACLEYYDIFPSTINYLCSIGIAKKSWKNLKGYGLKNLAEIHNIKFNHHRAGADAEVCAKLSLLAFQNLMITSTDEVKEVFSKKLKVI